MTRRLLVIWTNPLFRDSVNMLLKHPEVELIGATSDYVAARKTIQEKKPDTVLIEEIEGGMLADLMEILEANTCSVRLIVVNLIHNKINIFHCEQWTVAKESDLIRLILK